MVKILGIDPGSQYLGYGAVSQNESGDLSHISHGVISVPSKLSFSQKLAYIKSKIDQLIQQINPLEVVVENIFFGKNADSAFKLGHVRGVILCSAAESGRAVYEYAPKKIKKLVAGNGSATKEHVRAVVSGLLDINIEGKLDASDALSLAIARIHLRGVDEVLKNIKEINYDSFA